MLKSPLFSCLRAAGLGACCLWLALGTVAHAVEPVEPMDRAVIGPVGPEPIVRVGPDLSGSLSDLSIKPIKGGTLIKVAAVVTLKNSGSATARAVAATVYLSSTATLKAGEQPLAKLELATYRDGNGKVKPGVKVSIPLQYKLSPLLAAGLSGQYLIVVLSAEDYSKTAIVYGPLPKVP